MKNLMYNTDNYEAAALDYLEGTLPEGERVAFERFLDTHPEIARQVASLQRGMPELVPDVSVRFDGKAALKRKASARFWIYRATGVAAVLLVALLAYNRFGTPASDPAVSGDPVLLASDEPKDLPQAETSVSEAKLPITVIPEAITPSTRVAATTASAPVRKQPAQTITTPEDTPESRPVVATLDVNLQPVITLDAPAVELKTPVLGRARTVQVVEVTEEFVVENTFESVPETLSGNDRGFLNLLSKKGMKQLFTGIITPLSELSPVKVYEDNHERVVEFASIPVSRKSNQTQE